MRGVKDRVKNTEETASKRLARRSVLTGKSYAPRPFDACYACPFLDNTVNPLGSNCTILMEFESPCWIKGMIDRRGK